MKCRSTLNSFWAATLSALLLAAGALAPAAHAQAPKESEEGWAPGVKEQITERKAKLARSQATRTLLSKSFWKSATVSDVQKLIRKGADPDAKDKHGWTPLHWAVENGKAEAVEALLIEAGADPDTKDKDGWTPLHRAAAAEDWNRDEKIKLLLNAGADPKAKNNDGRTPRELAEAKRHYVATYLLRDAGG